MLLLLSGLAKRHIVLETMIIISRNTEAKGFNERFKSSKIAIN